MIGHVITTAHNAHNEGMDHNLSIGSHILNIPCRWLITAELHDIATAYYIISIDCSYWFSQ